MHNQHFFKLYPEGPLFALRLPSAPRRGLLISLCGASQFLNRKPATATPRQLCFSPSPYISGRVMVYALLSIEAKTMLSSIPFAHVDRVKY